MRDAFSRSSDHRGHAVAAMNSSPIREVALTPAEQALFSHLLAGLSNKEIAAAHDKAEATVKHQVSSILQKHGVPSRARLIAQAR
jgi:DNA-binding NarL/FixJ family response regulator